METENIELLQDGTVTTPEGFFAGGVHAGIKDNTDKLDLGILYSETPCTAAGMFTTSKIQAASVVLDREKLKEGRALAIVVNSGCANAYTGEKGMADSIAMGEMAAKALGISPGDVLVASTGVTGQLLPMEKIREGIDRLVLTEEGGNDLARAIMTTDTVPKETAIVVNHESGNFRIGSIAKGSGMIHPNMGTMFCFLTTDAAVEAGFLRLALQRAVDVSFNMISVDGDTSPSDTVIVLANGKAGNEPITDTSPLAGSFQQALEQVCVRQAKALARDGEGATKLIEVVVSGAATWEEAKMASKSVIVSSLVKTAVNGGDPNWGRIVAALGNSGVEVELPKIDVIIGEVQVLEKGEPTQFNEADVIEVLNRDTVNFSIDLNSGSSSATAWGCDLSQDYVTINSQYMT